MAILNLIDDLADHLVTELASDLFLGENLWKEDWKLKPTFSTKLIDSGSQSPPDPVVLEVDGSDHTDQHFEDRLVTVMTRCHRAPQGRELQEKISLVLNGRHNFTMGSFWVQGVEALNTPQVVEGSADTPYIFSTTFALLVRNDSSI